jgi:hypothetical protein
MACVHGNGWLTTSLAVVGVQTHHQSSREAEAVEGAQNTIDVPKGGVARFVLTKIRLHRVQMDRASQRALATALIC